MRRLILLVAALTLALGLFGTAEPAGATVTDDYCRWFNPNPGGYVISATRTVVTNGNLTLLMYCRYAPYVTPNYGPLCRHIGIGNLNDPGGTLYWYPAVPPPSWTCP